MAEFLARCPVEQEIGAFITIRPATDGRIMYKLLLCLRYLRTRYIALASIISVTLGVATMIVVNSVMAGFSTEMRDRIHGLLSDVIIETRSIDGMDRADEYMARVREIAGDEIAGMTATVEVYGLLSFQLGSQYFTRPVTLIGIEPEGKAEVGPLVDYLQSYNSIWENGELVRGPLRDAGDKPGWELTAEAQQRRIDWVEAERSWNRWANHAASSLDRQPARTMEQTAPIVSEVTPAVAEQDPAEASQTDPEDIFGTHDLTQVVAAEPSELPTVPFTATAQEQAAAAQREATKEARPGRVYIGQGLISYAEEDPKTGKFNTHMLVEPGRDVKISTTSAGQPPGPVHFDATVVDVFKSGMSEYDSNLVFCNLEYLQKMRNMVSPETGEGRITTIQIKLKDFHNSEHVIDKLRTAFDPQFFTVETWEQKQGPLLAAVDVESTILNVLLFLIIAVAGFGILAIFFMIVVEKTRDIGILKALGASSRGIMSIFLSYGLGLGIVGSGVGTVLGLLFVRYINEIEKIVTVISGRKVFDERIYYFPEIPTSVSPFMVFWVAAGAITIAVLASILPARRAARLHPVEALRYE